MAIDGKTLRRSFDRANGKTAVHSVAAFASAQGVVLGQVAVNDKENEITAIPQLLKLINVQGATVTIDAMGCQTAIAKAIAEHGGHYVLQVKHNHPTLRRHIEQFFTDAQREHRPLDDSAPEVHEFSTTDAGHGRIEQRLCRSSNDLSWIQGAPDWAGLAGIAALERIHEIVRAHWAIENGLHWVLDVTLDEDLCRIRSGDAAENLATVRRAALNLLRTAPPPPRTRGNVSLARKRRFCLMNVDYLETVLRLPPPSPVT